MLHTLPSRRLTLPSSYGTMPLGHINQQQDPEQCQVDTPPEGARASAVKVDVPSSGKASIIVPYLLSKLSAFQPSIAW